MTCKRCGSYAINHHCHGRDGSDEDLCDVCYWRKRAENPPLFSRYFVNAPSTLQEDHRYHGLVVLAPRRTPNHFYPAETVTAYPLVGSVVSLQLLAQTLSPHTK